MYKPSKAIFVLLTLALFLGACLPVAQQQPPAAVQNTPAVDVQAQISTSVAQTVEAQGQVATFVAQTMEAQGTATPTATLFAVPTFTALVLPTATKRPSSGGGGGGGSGGNGLGSGGPGSPEYDCAVVNQKPYDGDRIWHPGDSFDVEWTLKNIGTKTIPAGAYYQYFAETNFSPTPPLTLGYDVQPGDLFTIRIEAIAPQVYGPDKQLFVMKWAFIVNGDKICKPNIAIFVQRR